jgi:hypothetical protein
MILEDVIGLTESSGYSFSGSFTPDLIFSKLWLIRELAKITDRVSVMYVLGSWYSNLALLVRRYPALEVDKIINVETNSEFLSTGKRVLDQLGYNGVKHMRKDANTLDYQQLDDQGVVVNASLTDIEGSDWFQNIPPGTLVVMQARDRVVENPFSSAKDIQKRFPLSQVMYSGSLALKDPETAYTRFMIIGIK